MNIRQEDLDSIIDMIESNLKGIDKDVRSLKHQLAILDGQLSRLRVLGDIINTRQKVS